MPAEESVIAVYDQLADARRAIGALNTGGIIGREHISLVTHSLEDSEEVHGYLEYGDLTETDSARGAVVGGVLGILAGMAFFWVPGFGPLVVLGPLAGGLTGGAVGALVGAMSGWGIPRDQISRYERKVKEGQVLVLVHGNPIITAEAHKILEQTEPAELHHYAEDSSDAPEIDDREV